MSSPQRIGPYEVVRRIGSGSMAVVLLGRQPGLDRLVAMKLLRTDTADQVAVARFRREAEIMGRLRHKSIVRVLDLVDYNGSLCLVMEWVEGEPLSKLVGEGKERLARARVLWIVHDLARALHHAHEAGIVHRDVKPANVILRADDGKAMLTDFGLANDTTRPSHLTQTGFVVGTPLYMAPEQASGRGPVDAKSDTYSLGVLAFELLTGKNPNDAGSIRSVMKRAARGGIPAPSHIDGTIDPRIDRIVLKATARDRSGRYRNAAALADDLVELLDASGARDAPPRPPGALVGPPPVPVPIKLAPPVPPPAAGAREDEHESSILTPDLLALGSLPSGLAFGGDDGAPDLAAVGARGPQAAATDAPRPPPLRTDPRRPPAPPAPKRQDVTRAPAADIPRPPSAGGLRPPSAGGIRPPSAGGLRPPSAGGLRPPSAGGLRPPSAALAPPKKVRRSTGPRAIPDSDIPRPPAPGTDAYDSDVPLSVMAGVPETTLPSEREKEKARPPGRERERERDEKDRKRATGPREAPPPEPRGGADRDRRAPGAKKKTDRDRAAVAGARLRDRATGRRLGAPEQNALEAFAQNPQQALRSAAFQRGLVVAAGALLAVVVSVLVMWVVLWGTESDGPSQAELAARRARAVRSLAGPRLEGVLAEREADRKAEAERAKAEEKSGDLIRQAEIALFDSQSFQRGRALAEEAVAVSPDLAPAHAVLARALTRVGLKTDALGSWERAFSRDPGLLFDYLPTELDRHNDDIRDSLERWLSRAAEGTGTNAELANAILQSRRGGTEATGQVLGRIDALVEQEPVGEPAGRSARLVRAMLRWQVRDWEAAIADARALTEADEKDGLAHLLLGRWLYERRRWEDASGALQRAQDLRPDLAEPLYERARLALRRYRVDDARELFDRARGRAPDWASPVAGVAICELMVAIRTPDQQQRAGRIQQAADLARDALALEPRNGIALTARGWTKWLRGDPGDALADAEKAIEADPSWLDAHGLRGSALASLNRQADMDAAFEEWIRVCPDPVLAREQYGERLIQRGRGDDGFRILREVAEAHPDDVEAKLMLAYHLWNTGQAENVQVADQVIKLVVRARELDAPLSDAFCAFRGFNTSFVNGPPQSLARDRMYRNRQMRTLQQKQRDVGRVRQQISSGGGDVARLEQEYREVANQEPQSPLPHVELVHQFYLDRERGEKLGKTEPERLALALEHARAAVASCEPSGFLEWLPMAIATRACAELRNGLLDECAQSLGEAREAMRRPILSDANLFGQANRLIEQVQRELQQARAESGGGDGGSGGDDDGGAGGGDGESPPPTAPPGGGR